MPTADPIFDGPLADVVALPKRWAKVAQDRRDQSPVDAFADGYERAAKELQETLDAARVKARRLTPEAYGALPHVQASAQAVRRWCRAGELEGARHTAQGWEIPPDAVRVAKRRAA